MKTSSVQTPHPTTSLWWITGLGMLLGMLLFAPARVVALLIGHFSAQRIQIINPQGRWWQGTGDWIVSPDGQRTAARALPAELSWQVTGAWENGPTLQLRLQSPCCLPSGWAMRLGLGGSGWQLSWDEHHSHWPASWLTGWGAPWNTLQPEGSLQLYLPAGVLQPPLQTAQIGQGWKLQALDMASSLSPLKPLGSYEIRSEADGPLGLKWQLHTLRGPLQLQGTGLWQNGQLHFRGSAEATDGRETALANLLNLVGRRNGPRSEIAL